MAGGGGASSTSHPDTIRERKTDYRGEGGGERQGKDSREGGVEVANRKPGGGRRERTACVNERPRELATGRS